MMEDKYKENLAFPVLLVWAGICCTSYVSLGVMGSGGGVASHLWSRPQLKGAFLMNYCHCVGLFFLVKVLWSDRIMASTWPTLSPVRPGWTERSTSSSSAWSPAALRLLMTSLTACGRRSAAMCMDCRATSRRTQVSERLNKTPQLCLNLQRLH